MKKPITLALVSAFAGAALMYAGLGSAAQPGSAQVSITTISTSTTKPKPSAYCKKADIGKVVNYTTPSGSASYKLKCTVKSTQAWKKVTK